MSPTGNKGSIEQRVLRFIHEQRLITARQKLLVAVSGGPDSVCLLHVLVHLRSELGIDLHVAHLDHRLRGAESEADAAYVADLAARLGLPATVESRDVTAHRETSHTSPEEAARLVRYAFLAEVAAAVGAERVAVGHTRDDQVETIIMHLLRGSGTRGLCGLAPLTGRPSPDAGVSIIRPLLGINRGETAAYCRKHELNPRADASNDSLVPFRNRIRHELLPQLRRYNPQITAALLRTARIAADDLSFIDDAVARLWGDVARKEEESVVIDRKGFTALHPALQRHLLRAAIDSLLGTLKDIEAGHIEDVIAALDKPAGRSIGLPGGLNFTIEYDRYVLSPDAASLCLFPALNTETLLNVPGETLIPGWRIEAEVLTPTEAENKAGTSGEFTGRFDHAKTGSRLTVRNRRPGDRFQPLGMPQPKKLNEFMIDARVPRTWRRRIPIVVSVEQIIWVVGRRIDERVKVTPDTETVLLLRFTRT